jgi:hypothetical protein
MKKTLFLVCLMLAWPALAPASEECCFQGPGKCTEINFAHEKEICLRKAGSMVLDSSCKEAPECQLSEEPPAKQKSGPGTQSGKTPKE